MFSNAFQHRKIEGNLFSEVHVIGPLLAGLPLKSLNLGRAILKNILPRLTSVPRPNTSNKYFFVRTSEPVNIIYIYSVENNEEKH